MKLYGRSSSHFTRIARIFALEAEVAFEFVLIRDLMSQEPDDYGGHPAMKMPTLQTEEGIWFGSLPICRELIACSELNLEVIWPENLERPVAANAQELVTTAMSSEVGLIMGKATGIAPDNAQQVKTRASLLGAMEWLELNADRAIATLHPEKRLYVVQRMPMTEAAIDRSLTRDLYVSLGNPRPLEVESAGMPIGAVFSDVVIEGWTGPASATCG